MSSADQVSEAQRRSQIIEAQVTGATTADGKDSILRFKCKHGNVLFEEVVSYNKMLEWVERDKDFQLINLKLLGVHPFGVAILLVNEDSFLVVSGDLDPTLEHGCSPQSSQLGLVDHPGKLLGVLDMDLASFPSGSFQEVVLSGKEGQGNGIVLVDERCTFPCDLPIGPEELDFPGASGGGQNGLAVKKTL